MQQDKVVLIAHNTTQTPSLHWPLEVILRLFSKLAFVLSRVLTTIKIWVGLTTKPLGARKVTKPSFYCPPQQTIDMGLTIERLDLGGQKAFVITPRNKQISILTKLDVLTRLTLG